MPIDIRAMALNVVRHALAQVVREDASIPTGMSDSEVRNFSSWKPGHIPSINVINQNFDSKEKDPFKGVSKRDKEELLAWTVFKRENAAVEKTEDVITQSAEEVLSKGGKFFKSEKDLDKHLAKQLARLGNAITGLKADLNADEHDHIVFKEI